MINSVFRNRRNIHTIRGAMMIWICFGHCRGNRSEVSKNVNIIHFHEQKDKQFSFVDDLIGTNNVSSKIECAHLCANFYPCCASSFDHISNICLLNLECISEIESTLGSNVLTKTRAGMLLIYCVTFRTGSACPSGEDRIIWFVVWYFAPSVVVCQCCFFSFYMSLSS